MLAYCTHYFLLPLSDSSDRLVYRVTELIDLPCRNTKRRHQDNYIPQGTDDHAPFPCFHDDSMTGPLLNGEKLFGLSIRNKFDTHHESALAHLADVREFGKGLKSSS